jgi:hypothetical protein
MPMDGEVICYYIRFSEEVINQLGKVMPFGVGEAHPAYLSVRRVGDNYDVSCHYIDGNYRRVLWRQDTKPTWLRFTGDVINAKSKDEKRNHGSGGGK